MRVAEMTLDKFNDNQRGALTQANMERTARGLPNWVIEDFVRVHPGKFPGVDFEADAKDRADAAAKAVLPAQRVDQREV